MIWGRRANRVTSRLSSFDLVAPDARRTRREDTDGARTDWVYDSFDQLISAARTNSPNGAADAAYQHQYQYDLVGNRLHEDRGRQDLDGAFNNLNQLTHLTFGGQINILGTVSTTNSYVLVQGYTNAPPFYHLATNPPPPGSGVASWFGGAVVNPGSNSIPIVAWEGTNSTQSNLVVYLPPTNPQILTYDANGNLTSDGQRTFTWDEENRLTSVESVSSVVKLRSSFLYDATGRRAQRIDRSAWNGSSYNATNTTRFIYDGWNLLAELTAANTVSNYYCWGLDLSGSMQGAGGIGGLLAVTRPLTLDTFHFTFDGGHRGHVSTINNMDLWASGSALHNTLYGQ